MPDSPQVPDYITASLADLPPRPETLNILDVLCAMHDDDEDCVVFAVDEDVPDHVREAINGDLVVTARSMLACVTQHGNAEGHMEAFLGTPGGRDPNELLCAMQIWIDHVRPLWTGPCRHEDVIFTFGAYNQDNERIPTDDLPPHELLAARLIIARLDGDRAQFSALANGAIEEDVHFFINGAVGVLETCARTLREGA